MSKKILQLISGDFEDLEVWYPVYRCRGCTMASTACPARWR